MVTDRVLAALDAGVVPWAKPWDADAGQHRSMSTAKAYRGSNPFLLELAAKFDLVDSPDQPGRLVAVPKAEPWASPWWGTFDQIKARGGMVRKGEHGTVVTFWKQYEKRETMTDPDTGAELENVSERFALRYFRVFNADQCSGELTLPALPERPAIEPDAAAEMLAGVYLATGGPTLRHAAGDRAFYRHDTDAVTLPLREQFNGAAAYYATLFHELAHSTGHHSRLSRRGEGERHAFGCEAYAKEELVAEMGAAMLCATAGLEPQIDQTAAYVASWRQAIAEDSKLVVRAAAQAQRAADWIRGERYERSSPAPVAADAAKVAA